VSAGEGLLGLILTDWCKNGGQSCANQRSYIPFMILTSPHQTSETTTMSGVEERRAGVPPEEPEYNWAGGKETIDTWEAESGWLTRMRALMNAGWPDEVSE